MFYESGVYFDLNSRNFDGFYVNSDYAKLQFNNDLDKKAQLISVFYLRYQGRAPISRFQNIKVVNLYSVVKICENGFKVNALHKTFDFDTNFADENLQNKLICKFVDIFKQALNSGKAYGSYEV